MDAYGGSEGLARIYPISILEMYFFFSNSFIYIYMHYWSVSVLELKIEWNGRTGINKNLKSMNNIDIGLYR